MPKMTHIGIIEGYDARTPDNCRRRIQLRETKLYWINQFGQKYSKQRYGYMMGDWPMYSLDLKSIKPIST